MRRYLEALESHCPKRSRKRTPESIAKRLAAIDEQLGTADALNRLHLVQERLDLHRELAGAEGDGADLDKLEAAVVAVVAACPMQTDVVQAASRLLRHCCRQRYIRRGHMS